MFSLKFASNQSLINATAKQVSSQLLNLAHKLPQSASHTKQSAPIFHQSTIIRTIQQRLFSTSQPSSISSTTPHLTKTAFFSPTFNLPPFKFNTIQRTHFNPLRQFSTTLFKSTKASHNPPIPPSFRPNGLPTTPRGYTVQPTILQQQPGINVNVTMPGGGMRLPMMGGLGGGARPRGLFGAVFFSVTVLLITWTIFDALSGAGGGGLSGDILGRKHKQAITGDIPDRISDVIGVDDVLDQVKELIEFLQQPEKYREMGAQIPRGILLTGPPGTGKTLIARCIAGESGVNFLWCSAADFDEIYVGTGSRRIRDLFQDARSKAPCIIFIDEIDALGKRNSMSGNSSRNTINSILVEMDGFQASDNVMVMAATNFPDLLDEALVRPGRFDYQLALRAPDYEGRIKLFQHYINKVKHDGKVNAERLASAIMGATGADIKTIVNNAAVRAAARSAKAVTHEDVEEAQEQFVMGVKITTKAIDLAASTRTAYHEAGHALLSILMPGSDPIFKATILPRGQALGHVAFAGNDKMSITRTELEARLVCAMGGRAAEELIFGEEEVSTGCSSDLEQANKMANGMIKSYGFGGRTGKVIIDKESSGDLHGRADREVEDVVNTAYQTAKQLLTEHHLEHDRLAKALLRYEMLTSDDIQQVIKGNDLPHRIGKDIEPVMNITTPNKYSLFKPNGHNANVKLNVATSERSILNFGSEQVHKDQHEEREKAKGDKKDKKE